MLGDSVTFCEVLRLPLRAGCWWTGCGGRPAPAQGYHLSLASRDPGQRRGRASLNLQQPPCAGAVPSCGISVEGLETDENDVSCCPDLSDKTTITIRAY